VEGDDEMTHKIQWEDYVTTQEFDDLPLGTTIHTQGNGSYTKVGGFGRHHPVLLLRNDDWTLHAPEAVLLFK